MSLVRTFAGLASSLIGPSGLAGTSITFARIIPGEYDPISGVTAPSTVMSWPATAIEVENEGEPRATTDLAPSGQRLTRRTFRVPGLGITPPQNGDTLTVAGVTLRVGPVKRVGAVDAVTVPLYTVECAA